MSLINKASFAKQLNITRASVTNNAVKGRIKVNEEGLIDPEDPVNLEFIDYIKIRKDSELDKKRTGRPKGTKSKPRSRPNPAPIQRVDFSNGNGYPTKAEELIKHPKIFADHLKVVEAWEQKRLENARKRGELIDRDLVQRFISKTYAIDTNEFLASSGKIANLVAGICGVNDDGKILEIENAIQAELYKTLSHIKRLMDDYLSELEEKANE